MSQYKPVDTGDSGWGTTFHRHPFSNEIHRDIDPCKRLGRKIQVYVFDPEYLEEHTRQAKADGFDEGVRASGLDLDYILQLLDTNPYRSQP